MPREPLSHWCPPELTAAAGPLLVIGRLMHELSDEARGLEHLLDSVPSAQVRAAFVELVERWDRVIWGLAGTAHALGQNLHWAAEDYQRAERAITQTTTPGTTLTREEHRR